VEAYDAVGGHDPAFETVPTHPNDPYTVTYTSGTTGQPKGVPSTHGGPVHLHAFTEFVVDLRPEDTYFVAASPAWSYGLTMGSVVAGMVGTAIGCYRGKFDPAMLLETFEEFGVDNAMVPPTALRGARAAGVDPTEYDIDLRTLLSAGEALDAETVEWCRDGLGAEPQDAYGLTEAGMAVCNYAFDDWAVKPGSMGKPTPGMTVALLDDDGERVAQGETGEICIRREADAVGGYWGKPEESMDTFRGPRRRGRLLVVRRPQGQRHRQRGLPDRPRRGRGDAARPRGRRRGLRRRPAGRDPGAGRDGLREPSARLRGERRTPRGARGLRSRAALETRVPARGGVPRRTAEDGDREGPEGRTGVASGGTRRRRTARGRRRGVNRGALVPTAGTVNFGERC
jgi:acyl-CoA synthetase (AMP-forming)/AMP-acid ligase II